MKLPYIKTFFRFPRWGKFNTTVDGDRYSLGENNSVIAMFDDDSSLPHFNHIEMSGFDASSIVSYRIDSDRRLRLRLFVAIPSLRMYPNVTQSSLTAIFSEATFGVDKEIEKVNSVAFDGILSISSATQSLAIERRIMTAYDKKNLIEIVKLSNTSGRNIEVVIENKKRVKKIAPCYTATGNQYILHTRICVDNEENKSRSFTLKLSPNEQKSVYISYGYDNLTQKDILEQELAREKFIAESKARLTLITPDKNINAMFEFSKIRASESIFNTKNGLMHSPGGGWYYGALWTNDECQYANPMFAYLGYDKAVEESENCYRLFSNYVSQDSAVFSSVIACGDGHWEGAGDRGDTSMYLYGLSRYLLTTGDKDKALKFLPYINDALTYVKTKINHHNIIESDSDELENRFESGVANLSTSVISYDAFVSLSYLYNELGYTQKSIEMDRYIHQLRLAIESYFGDNVEGYDTYRYCKEENNLRAWICLPLTVGIDVRKDGTVAALMSDKLRNKNGILTRSGEKVYWDRSTLYSMLGMFYVGKVDEGYELLTDYTNERLLHEHVPYAIEAYPEGNAAHLSAESALYVRIIVEGILGYRPIGFASFELKLNLPKSWDKMSIKSLCLCGRELDIDIAKVADEYAITINNCLFNTAQTIQLEFVNECSLKVVNIS